ncbi:hypothetical protein KIPB_013626, partial [Kipferlia bialata]|eukprot:g13626.t1
MLVDAWLSDLAEESYFSDSTPNNKMYLVKEGITTVSGVKPCPDTLEFKLEAPGFVTGWYTIGYTSWYSEPTTMDNEDFETMCNDESLFDRERDTVISLTNCLGKKRD